MAMLSILLAFLMLSGCTATRDALIDVQSSIEPSNADKAYKATVMVLLDKGFDLKMNDKDLRVTTTEYKKFASVSGWPPFDFYIQIKAVIRDMSDGKYRIVLTPKIKEQNRLNSTAFTERSLIMYSEKEQKEDYAIHSGPGKAMLDGQMLFLSIVQNIADALNLPSEQFMRNLERIEVMGM
jgi:hypothetical protein